MKNELSVVIPAFNEQERIKETIVSVCDYLRKKDYVFEVIVVNDGSTDTTLKLAQDLLPAYSELSVLDLGKNQGKGMAVKAGVLRAGKDYCLFMDADNATSIAEWEKMESCFDEGARAVVASRRIAGSKIVHPQPWVRRILGGVYRVLCRFLFRLEASDFNCGFKAYQTQLAKKIYSRVVLSDWAFDTEVFCLLKKEGVKVHEIPVRWEHREKKSHLAPFRSGFHTLSSLLKLKTLYP